MLYVSRETTDPPQWIREKKTYLIIPLLDWQRVSDSEPVSMNLKVGRLTIAKLISRAGTVIEGIT